MCYLHHWCGRERNCLDRRCWAAVWSDCCWTRGECSSFNVVTGTIGGTCQHIWNIPFTVHSTGTLGTLTAALHADLFWLPCISRNCQRSRPLFGSSLQSLLRRRRHHRWTITPRLHPATWHLCGIYWRENRFVMYTQRDQTHASARTDLLILWLCRSFSCSYLPFSPLNVCTYSMGSSAL